MDVTEEMKLQAIGVAVFALFNYLIIFFKILPFFEWVYKTTAYYGIPSATITYKVYWTGAINDLLKSGNQSYIWQIIDLWNIVWLLGIPICLFLSFKDINELLNEKLQTKRPIPFHIYAIFLALVISVVQTLLFYLAMFIQDAGGASLQIDFILMILLVIGWTLFFYLSYNTNEEEMTEFLSKLKTSNSKTT